MSRISLRYSEGEKYHPDKYFWPVFSIKNYVQRADGWFDRKPNVRRRKRLQIPKVVYSEPTVSDPEPKSDTITIR